MKVFLTFLILVSLVAVGCNKVDFEKVNDGSLSSNNSPSPSPFPMPSPSQPTPGVPTTSYFFVKRAADILFVVDSSGSMADEQNSLKNGFPSFTSALNTLSGDTLDWHVAITTTDIDNVLAGDKGDILPFSGLPAGTYYLDKSIDATLANVAFQATVLVGTSGSGDERGIAAARMTAQREFDALTTRNFIRADTPLSVIVLSDEDERSTRDPSDPQFRAFEPIDEPANFVAGIQALDTLSTIPKTVTFHSIVTSTQACLDGTGQNMGTTYVQLSQLTNGFVGDICALTQSYQQQLQFLAGSIVNEAKTYTLPCLHVSAPTLTAYQQVLGGALIPVAFSFVSPNKLVLQTAPPVGSLIKAKYECLP